MPVHMRNGRAYGGIPNGTVKAETPSSVPTTIKQLNVVGAVGDIAPVTIPEAVKFANGNTVEDAVENFAQIETSPTSSTHAVGTHLVWNGILYTVKTAIDAGENLVINSNIERTYVADELEALNNGLTNVVTGTLTANAGVTLDPNFVTVFKVGRVCTLSCIVTLTEGKGAYTRLIEIPEGFRPYRQIFRDCGNYKYDITSSGGIRNVGALSSGSQLMISETFVCN